MSATHCVIAGRVQAKTLGGIGYVRVRVIHEKGKRSLCETYTNEHGEFRAHIASEELKGGPVKVTVKAVDAKGRAIGQLKGLSAEMFASLTRDMNIPDDVARKAAPAIAALEKKHGGVIDPEAKALIADAITAISSPATPIHNRFSRAALCPLPPIDVLETLVDDAWRVLDGNPVAIGQYRQTLKMFASDEASKTLGTRIIEKALNGTGGCCGSEPGTVLASVLPLPRSGYVSVATPSARTLHDRKLPFRRPRSISAERLIPVVAAAIVSARDEAEAGEILSALQTGLCGLDRYELLLDAAHESLSAWEFDRFRGLLNRFAGECGPDDGPLPPAPNPPGPECPKFPPIREFPPVVDELWACVRDVLAGLHRRLFGSPNQYEIVSVMPDIACPGDKIIIRGTNFGSVAGEVCFTSGASGGQSCQTAMRWTDTEIEVVVPQDAADGWISLSIMEEVVSVCGRAFTIYRGGNAVPFDGGSAMVSVLAVNNRTADSCVRPDSDAIIRWSGSAGSTVRITVTRGGTTMLDQSNLPDVGSITFRVPAANSDRTYRVTAVAASRCGTHSSTLDFVATVIPALTIEGIEVTQGIQRFWRAGVAPNSLPNIANKDTIARVYISCDRNGFANDRISNVTGTLTVDGVTLAPINGITPTNPGGANPFITARRRAEIDRTRTNHTLNFRIPAALCQGTQTLRVAVGVDFTPCNRIVAATRNQIQTWQDNNALRVRFVRVRDDNATNGTNQRPTTNQCRFTILRCFDLLPSPPTDIAPAWQAAWNTTRDVTTDSGLRGLLNDLDDEHNCSAWEWMWEWTGLTECPDDDHAEWVGLTVPFNRGWATGGNTCMSAIYQDANGQGATLRVKTAHELGHNLGFCHDDQGCGGSNPDGTCTNKGQLDDVPFDPYWNQALRGSVFDYMSYACTRWVDESSWQTLIANI